MKFRNRNKYLIQLSGPDKQMVRIEPGKEYDLPEFFTRYCPKYLVKIKDRPQPKAKAQPSHTLTPVRHKSAKKIIPAEPVDIESIKQHEPETKARPRNVATPPQRAKKYKAKRGMVREHNKLIDNSNNDKIVNKHVITRVRGNRRQVVGSAGRSSPQLVYRSFIENNPTSISNNIGVGILSYNRPESLLRLLNSIEKHTNLLKTTVFVSDESNRYDSRMRNMMKEKPWVVFMQHSQRLGIAGNANRLLRCLSRFKYKLLLNDDVEVVSKGWDSFYFDAMRRADMHHFCYRQHGVYGANAQTEHRASVNGVNIKTVQEKPHGAVMALDDVAFDTVGFFDESFGLYGMEHVDWSNRVSLSKIQMSGFHDVCGSNRFFKIHPESSSVENQERLRSLHNAKERLEWCINDVSRIKVDTSDKTNVDAISYIIPVRMSRDRNMAIKTVINNIKAQKYPHIEIILVEQDERRRIEELSCVRQLTETRESDKPFNKSMAFNVGVMGATHKKLILHDGDIIVPDSYTAKASALLNTFDSFHIGSNVLYLNQQSTQDATRNQEILSSYACERMVEYFEGGSLGCNKSAYLSIGGFCETFRGYGCEDCEFFSRLKDMTYMCDDRSENFVHLWHGRVGDWASDWKNNQRTQEELNKDPVQIRTNKIKKEFEDKYHMSTHEGTNVKTKKLRSKPKMLAWFNDGQNGFIDWFGGFVDIIFGNEKLFKDPLSVNPDIIYAEWMDFRRLDAWEGLKNEVPIIQWLGDCWGMNADHMITHNPKFTTHTFVVDYKSIEVAKEHGFDNVSWAQHGNEFWYKPLSLPYRWDIIFTGSSYADSQWPGHYFPLDNDRVKVVRALSKQFNMAVFGRNWHKVGIQASPYVDRPNVNELFAQSKIILCHDIVDIPGFTSERTFDAWAGSHCVLMKHMPDIESLGFADRENVIFYRDEDEAVKLAKYYLQHDDDRISIAQNGYKTFRQMKLSYTDRMKNVVSFSNPVNS